MEDKDIVLNKKMNIASTNVSSKFDQSDWLSIEQECSKFDKHVIECLLNLGSEKDNIKKSEYYAIGNFMYNLCHELINSKFKLSFTCTEVVNEEHNKKSKKQKNKALQIRIDNAMKRIKEKITDYMNIIDEKQFNPHSAFTSDIIEIKGVGLMYCAWYIEHNKNELLKYKYLPMVLGIIVTIQRFLTNCQLNKFGKSLISPNEDVKISEDLVTDLKLWFDKCKAIYPYNGFVIYDYAPELLVYTDYDSAIPQERTLPREHQRKLIDTIKNNMDSGFLIPYNAMIGSGKTVCSIAIASLIIQIRNKYPDLELLFCCNLRSVKNQVANLCYNAEIKFGLAHIDKRTNSFKIINHNTCKTDEQRIVVIASPDATYDILSKNTNENKYILFLDEPTIGADIKVSDVLKENMKVITKMPKRTILSSATFPEISKLTPIIENYKKKYKNILIDTIYTDEIQISCDVKTYENQLIVPHLGIKNNEDLIKVINVIKTCPFLGRIYTAKIVKTLWNLMNELKVENLSNLSDVFNDVDNLTANKVKNIAINLLDILVKQNDTIIEKVCHTILDDKVQIEIEKDDVIVTNDPIFEDENKIKEDNVTDKVEFMKLGTIQAYRFLNMNLIATPDPYNFALKYFAPLLDDIKNFVLVKMGKTDVKSERQSTYKSAKNILNIYNQELKDYEKQLESFERIKDQDKLFKLKQDFTNPKIKFPDYGQVNTNEHIKRYAKGQMNTIIKRFIRVPLNLESLSLDKLIVPDDILSLLFAGIGVYTQTHPNIDQFYLNRVLDLASEGRLAYLIADSSICYGTNYPINRVFITDEFSNIHSMNTLFQLMGRAGRVGRSWIAETYITTNIAKRIIDYTREIDKNKLEIENMNYVFNKITSDNANQELIKKELEKDKYTTIKKISEIDLTKIILNKPVCSLIKHEEVRQPTKPKKYVIPSKRKV
jgi:hypothetical protein